MLIHKAVNVGDWTWDEVNKDFKKVIAKGSDYLKLDDGNTYVCHQGNHARLSTRADRLELEGIMDRLESMVNARM